MNYYLNKLEIENDYFIKEIYEIFKIYFDCGGSRNQQKSNHFHSFIKTHIEKYIKTKKLKQFEVKLEQNIKSTNANGKKKCDIVVFKNNNPYLILPVKLAMSSYKKNKNNYWETMTGELLHLKWANPEIKIIPINILFNKYPNLDKNKKIKNIENINFKDIEIYNILEKKCIVDKFINYILEVEHKCKKGDIYNNYNSCPIILGFNKNTPYIPIYNILNKLIN